MTPAAAAAVIRAKIDTALASLQPVPRQVSDERILESTQEIRNIGRDLIENDWPVTGDKLIRHALEIESALLGDAGNGEKSDA